MAKARTTLTTIRYSRANDGIEHSAWIATGCGFDGPLWEANTAAPRGCWYAFKSRAGIWHVYSHGANNAWNRCAEGSSRDEAVRNAVRYATR